MIRRRLLPALAALAVSGGLLTVPPGQASAAVGTAADDGAKVVSETRVDARTIDLVVDSPALKGRASVRLLLPPTWSTKPTATYPELWLLHGANEPKEYQSWTAFTNVRTLLADKNVLAVLPGASSAALYSDVWGVLGFGGPKWETFHTVELPQIIARGYRGNGRRVVAGLSSGGLGAFKYAANHPGLFRAAAAYSGLLDTRSSTATVRTIELRAFQAVDTTWGNPLLQASIWARNNPLDLAPKLAGTPLYISSGNGQAGPLDPAGTGTDLVIEPQALRVNQAFADKARGLGLNVTTDFYGPGTHSWPYWERELTRSWPFLARGLGL